MDKLIITINEKKLIVCKENNKYFYNNKELDYNLVEEFVSKLIKICRARERMNNKSNHKIEIYNGNDITILTGIDIQVIKYINSFLK